MRKYEIATAVLLTVLMAPPAAAQGVFDMGMLTNTLSIDSVTQSERERAAEREPMSAAPVAASTTYVPSAARTKVNVMQFINTLSQTGAADPELEKILMRPDFIPEIGKGLKTLNLKTNDVADMVTIYLMNSWDAANGITEDRPVAAFAAVRRQIGAAFVSAPMLASANDATKQEMAETLLLHAMMADALNKQAKEAGGDQPAKVAAAAVQGAKRSFGFDLTSLVLTDQGFSPAPK